MSKTLCKMGKHRAEAISACSTESTGQIAKLVCRKCGRMAPKKKFLCKAKKS